MTKITVCDTYLNKVFSFFVNQEYENIEEVEKKLRIHDYLYFPVIAVQPANRLEQWLIPHLCKSTENIINVLFYNYKYLIIN